MSQPRLPTWRRGADDQPWFLAIGLVNPHDIMWFPVDQPWYQDRYPDYTEELRSRVDRIDWGRETNLPRFEHEVERWFTELPPNFDANLFTKPEVHRRWMTQMESSGMPGVMHRDDADVWLQGLDYYAKLHQLNDECVAQILGALDETDQWNDTIVIFTSDHGDQCGSHRLRSKGPWNYQETMRIPLYIKALGITEPGSKSDALASHVDLARTIAEFGGVDAANTESLRGESLTPLFDGRYKYCRYYGIGGGNDAAGNKLTGDEMLFGRDAGFDDHDHEFYDLQEDPHELVNLAMDPTRRSDLRARFAELRTIEHETYANGF